ncbi:uncharacterized protein LOC130724887 [Lotus japonicus]|uniref:uncharacterized protein LOC130724887 n=1 Tax=Lotus japonicus TaxID=34305 RepID=UPI0025834012|nr:uncharacterized protein LOC130724887 [Lotus japonicus]
MDLLDIPLAGRKFTWQRLNNRARSRIDRFLVSSEWNSCWNNCSQLVLNRDISDHCPLLLRQCFQNWGPKPFRVLNCWLQDPRITGVVDSFWKEATVNGWGAYVLKEKLKRLKGKLKQWNRDVFGDLKLRWERAVQLINELDAIEEEEGPSQADVEERKELLNEFWAVLKHHERANSIVGLLIDGVWEENPGNIKKEAMIFFENKFRSEEWDRPTLDGVQFKRLSQGDNTLLLSTFSEEEIKATSVSEFWSRGVWPKGSNASFIVLIPKVPSPQGLGEFRPIFLIGCIYKVVSKLLAARLKLVLGKVIDDRQFAFLGGRNMLDSVVVVNEIVHEARIRKQPTIIYKVDYEKTYDSVQWDFLFYMMRRLNFDQRWIGWIKNCLESASVSVLVNGSPSSEFKMEKGLRQGDPLALFLFLIVAEGLNGLFMNAVKLKKFSGFKVGGKESVEVSLLQFADDTIFLGEASLQNTVVIKCVLRCFELISDLKVNFNKSKLATISQLSSERLQYAAILHCKLMEVPFTYLGLSVAGCSRRSKIWEPVIQKFKAKLSAWRMKSISFGGRICLIQSVLSALALYYLSFFRMPPGVIKICNGIMRNFLWGGGGERRRIAWVSWSSICKPKDVGGLGLKDLTIFNKTLLGKWRWRFLTEPESLWCRVIKAKYSGLSKMKESLWWKDVKNVSCDGEGDWFELGVQKYAPTLLPPDPIFTRVWKSVAPSNVKAFAWRVMLNRIPCLQNLWKRNVLRSQEEAICKVCCLGVESCEHLLFSCPVSLDIWRQCYWWLGVYTALPMNPREHLLQFQFGGNQKQQRGADAIWLAVIWTLWLIRNDIIFRNGEVDLSAALEMVK